MAFLIEVAIIDGGASTIKVVHQFDGLTRTECETYKREHLSNCDYFRTAEEDGRTVESVDEIDDESLPTPGDYGVVEEEEEI